jgi:outer membrane protein OmpA-like peptidoglycan-associated protein
MKAPYIFSTACLDICIWISPLVFYHLVCDPVRAFSLTSKARAALSSSLLSAKQYQGGMRRRRGTSASVGIPALGQSPSGIGSQAATTTTKGRDQTRAYPHFLKRSLLFEPNSVGFTSESERRLALDAGWLRMHPEIRTVVVGFCDPGGSEQCTHELAESRGNVVRQLLVKYGVGSSQIVAVRGWEKADPVCEAATPPCQEMNRRARIFIAGFSPAGSHAR